MNLILNYHVCLIFEARSLNDTGRFQTVLHLTTTRGLCEPHREPNWSCFTQRCVVIYSSGIDFFEGKVQALYKFENGPLHCIYLFWEMKKVNMFPNAFQLLENGTAELWSPKKEQDESFLNLKDLCCHLYTKFPCLFCHKRSLGKFSSKFFHLESWLLIPQYKIMSYEIKNIFKPTSFSTFYASRLFLTSVRWWVFKKLVCENYMSINTVKENNLAEKN